MTTDYTDLLARVEGLEAGVGVIAWTTHGEKPDDFVRIPLADLRALVAAVREMGEELRDLLDRQANRREVATEADGMSVPLWVILAVAPLLVALVVSIRAEPRGDWDWGYPLTVMGAWALAILLALIVVAFKLGQVA